MAGLRQAITDGARSPLLELPTGAGKTVIAAHIVAGARAKGKRVAFCVPALSLVDQTYERFVANGIPAVDMGVMQGDHPWRRPHAPVQIATAQTLGRRSLPLVDVVVIDEAHIRHKIYDRWIVDGQADAPRPLFIGLSATPWARGLGKLFDALVQPVSLAGLIEAGMLSRFRVFAPSHPDLTGVRTVAGDYHEGDLGKAMSRPTLVADIVETWLARRQHDGKTLCFCVNRLHARMVHDAFAEVGVRVAYVDANTSREERIAIGRSLEAGQVQVVVNIGTLTTGVDWDIRCLILARPTRSEMLFVQIIGRGLRTAPGKTDCLILDHSDTHQRLGMVTDIYHGDLDTGRKRATGGRKADDKGLPLPVCCPTCSALMPAGSRLCGACGAAMPLPVPVMEVDGDLVEISSGYSKPTQPARIVDRLRKMPRARLLSELEGMRISKGYSAGWVKRGYHEITGGWPRDRWQAAEPSPDVMKWAYSKAKAYAKAMEAKKAAEASHAP